MTDAQKIIKTKVALLKLAEHLGSVSLACEFMGYSRDSFYRFKKLYESQGETGLVEVNRRKPLLKNRVRAQVEETVLSMALEHPKWGQLKVSQELTKGGISISPGGVRCVWMRHDLQTSALRLRAAGASGRGDSQVFSDKQPTITNRGPNDGKGRSGKGKGQTNGKGAAKE